MRDKNLTSIKILNKNQLRVLNLLSKKYPDACRTEDMTRYFRDDDADRAVRNTYHVLKRENFIECTSKGLYKIRDEGLDYLQKLDKLEKSKAKRK